MRPCATEGHRSGLVDAMKARTLPSDCTSGAASPKLACSDCGLREICLPEGLGSADLRRVDRELVATRCTVSRGEALFRQGDAFGAVDAVWTGCFKTRTTGAGGRERVSGFQMSGDLIGLDAIGSGRFQVDAVALETSQVCVIRYAALQRLVHELPMLQQQFHRMMSREIARQQSLKLLLGGAPPEPRVAAFLLDLTQRMRARLFRHIAAAAHDAPRDRQPARADAGDRQPRAVAPAGSRLRARADAPDPHRQPGGAAAAARPRGSLRFRAARAAPAPRPAARRRVPS